MTISNIVCITSETENNDDIFGSSIAINNKYLAIGNYMTNRVVIYTRDNSSGQWRKTGKVSPPKDSIPEQVGYGFSEKLQLDGDFLIISSSIVQDLKKAVNPENFQKIANSSGYFHERYLVNLDTRTEAKPIGLPIEKSAGLVTFNLFSEGKIRKVTLPDREEETFGASFAYYKNLLLVGSPSYMEERGAWLYDLDDRDREPEKLAVPKVYMGETVALNDEFAVVGDPNFQRGPYRLLPENIPNRPKLTLIRAIKSGLTTTVEKIGKLSLSGDILAFMNPSSNGLVDGGILEVHRLNKNPESHLILRRGYVANAFVQNGFLVTVLDNYELGSNEIHIQEIV